MFCHDYLDRPQDPEESETLRRHISFKYIETLMMADCCAKAEVIVLGGKRVFSPIDVVMIITNRSRTA